MLKLPASDSVASATDPVLSIGVPDPGILRETKHLWSEAEQTNLIPQGEEVDVGTVVTVETNSTISTVEMKVGSGNAPLH